MTNIEAINKAYELERMSVYYDVDNSVPIPRREMQLVCRNITEIIAYLRDEPNRIEQARQEIISEILEQEFEADSMTIGHKVVASVEIKKLSSKE